MKRAFVVALFGLLLGACAGQPKRDESAPLDERLARLGYVRGQAVDSIQRIDIDGWQYLDKQHIVLGQGVGGAYLIAFSRPCRNLAFSNALGYGTTVGTLTRRDRIVSSDGSGFPEQCLVAEMYRLAKVQKPRR